MKKLVAILSVFGMLLVVENADAASFRNCANLRKVYANGVAKSRVAASKQIVRPIISSRIYRLNAKLDRDRDGTVCESDDGVSLVGGGVTLPGSTQSLTPPSTSTTTTTITSTTTTTPLRTFTSSATWGEISATQVAAPQVGSCTEIPLVLDIRSQSGLGIGLIVSAKDNYTNLIGEARPDTSIGIRTVPIKVCREAWVYTFPSGVNSDRAATLYCGVKFSFFPTQPTLDYRFSDAVCTSSSARLQ